MDFTVNITASPDLLSVLNRIAGVIETLLITPPKTIIVDVITDNANSNNVQEHAQLTSSQAIQQNSHAGTYPSQNTGISKINLIQNQVPASVITMYNQAAAVPVSQVQAQQLPSQQIPQPQNSIVPTSAQTYTPEQLAVAATQLLDAGRRNELVGLLNSFGVQALTALPKEQYGAFATQLRSLGAKI